MQNNNKKYQGRGQRKSQRNEEGANVKDQRRPHKGGDFEWNSEGSEKLVICRYLEKEDEPRWNRDCVKQNKTKQNKKTKSLARFVYGMFKEMTSKPVWLYLGEQGRDFEDIIRYTIIMV